MSDGNLNISFTTEEKDLVKAQAKVIKQQEEMIEKYKKMGAESKKSSKEAEKTAKDAAKYAADATKELERFATATKMINRTPLEKYADTMRQLDRALKAGKLDQESFNRAAASAKREFDGVGRAGQQAFGSSALGNLASYATGMLGVASAIGLATKLFTEYRRVQDEAGEKQFLEAPSLGELAQLADIKPGDMQRITNEAKRTLAEGGAKTLPEAVNLQKALASGDIEEWRADASRMQASGLVPNAELMTTGVIKLAAGLGKGETGNFREIVSKAFGGAKLGLGSAEELLAATAQTAQQGKRLGLTDEELMAAVSTASAISGPAEAATQIEALMKGIEVEGIGGWFLTKGDTLRQHVARLKELEASGVDIREMLGGRQEAIKGFGVLSDAEGQAAMAKNLANIDTAVKEDWFGQRVKMAESDPGNAAAILKRQALARDFLSKEGAANMELVADAIESDILTDIRVKRGGFAATMAKGQTWMDRMTWGNEAFIRDYGATASPETKARAEALGFIIDSVAGKFEYLGDTLDSTISGTERTNAARANQAAAGGAVEAR